MMFAVNDLLRFLILLKLDRAAFVLPSTLKETGREAHLNTRKVKLRGAADGLQKQTNVHAPIPQLKPHISSQTGFRLYHNKRLCCNKQKKEQINHNRVQLCGASLYRILAGTANIQSESCYL